MKVLEGKSVFSGIAIGKISILQKADTSVKRTKVENPEAEITRVQEAKEKAVEQLQKLYDKALREVGESGAAIFEVHQMMLDDEDYLDSIDNIIRTENVNAEYAVATTGDNFADMFAQMDDDYMKPSGRYSRRIPPTEITRAVVSSCFSAVYFSSIFKIFRISFPACLISPIAPLSLNRL